ncbi:MAG: transposase [Lachnospiraceae bacterium]|nr:transposase [Lachnospiraceae bacterium]
MKKRVCKADQIRLIMECRQSGLSDYQWCEKNGIHPGTFYNWVSKLRKSGYTFPESEARSNAIPARQDVVKVDVVSCQEPSPVIEQNVSLAITSENPSVVAELLIGDITLRLFNGANEQLIQSVLRCIGGINHAW